MDSNKKNTAKKDTTANKLWLSFGDLRAQGVVGNWQTLRHWQEDPTIAFPQGVLFGPNSRRWSKDEIDAWTASRPAARSDFDAD